MSQKPFSLTAVTTYQRRGPTLQLKPLDLNVPIFQQITADVSPLLVVKHQHERARIA